MVRDIGIIATVYFGGSNNWIKNRKLGFYLEIRVIGSIGVSFGDFI